MTPRRLVWVASLAAVASVDRADACAACRNPSMPTAHASGAPLAEGSLRTDATLTGTTIHVVHTAGCEDTGDCDEVPVQPLYLHDQRMTPIELRLGAEYALTDTFGLELQLPFRAVISRIDYTTPDGDPYDPIDRDVHHRDETIAGAADGLLLGRAGASFDGTWLALRVGVSLPIGESEEDPFALGDQGLSHQHVQLGNGTFEPALSLEASHGLEDFTLQAFVFGQMAVYANRYGYRAPLRVQGSVEGSTKLVSTLSGALGVGVYHEGPERWQGVVRQDGSLGRTELTAQVAFDYAIDATVLRVGARFPWYRNIVAGEEPLGEFSSPFVAYVGASHTWDLTGSP